MTNADNHPIDVAEERRWLIDHKTATGMSWSELAKRTGIAPGTLSQFGSERGYAGDEEGVARKVLQFRQLLAAQAQIQIEAPALPGFFETRTSREIESLLSWAQRGRITVIATGAGVGKTTTLRNYQASVANVWVATMAPSTAGVNNMQIEALASLGERDAKGTPQALSRRIRDKVAGTGGLLAFDEAQHLSEKSIEEIRSWHDATGIGIALLGNESVISRLEGGSRKAAFAQLYSRVGMRMVRNAPLADDADALSEAWGIHDDERLRAYVRKVAMMPGGLRSATMMLEVGTILASAERSPLSLANLQDAWAQLSHRPVAS